MALVAGVGGLILLSGQSWFGTTVSLGLIVAFIAYRLHKMQPRRAVLIAGCAAVWLLFPVSSNVIAKTMPVCA